MMTRHTDLIISDTCDAALLSDYYQARYFTHILCRRGRGECCIDGIPYRIERGDIAIWLPKIAVTNLQLSDDFEASILLMSYEIATKNNPDTSWGIKGYLFTKEQPVVRLSTADFNLCRQQLKQMNAIRTNTAHRFGTELQNLYVQIFILNMWNIFATKIEEQSSNNGQRASLFERFLQLAETHCIEHREVAFYSDKLHITTKYLTELCRKNSGKTASDWIRNYTIRHILTLLRNPQLTMSEIADALNFSSESFFSRYVRSVLGMSPRQFRKRLQQPE